MKASIELGFSDSAGKEYAEVYDSLVEGKKITINFKNMTVLSDISFTIRAINEAGKVSEHEKQL